MTRTYAIEEIGVSRGPKLGFDHIGRLAVISGANYVVLNDNTWLDISDKDDRNPPLMEVIEDDGENYYFGALASWGKIEFTEQGRIDPLSYRPEQYPRWINTTNFTKIVFTDDYTLFTGQNGLVCLNRQTGEQSFHQMSIATVFTLGQRVFVSSNAFGTIEFDPKSGESTNVAPTVSIHEVAYLDDTTIVGATNDTGLVSFDGEQFSFFDFGFGENSIVRISCLETLPDGGFAVAVDSEGVFVFSADGERKLALTTSDYRRIFAIASREPGILWISRESSVQKLLYNDPVSVVDQRSEVVIGWPQVSQWGDKTVIASNGRLYEMRLAETGWQYTFEEFENVPISGAWAIAGNEKHLLIGNSEGVFRHDGSGFEKIPGIEEANRLVLQEKDICIVIGSREIAALAWDGNRWYECAPKLQGVGFPAIMHSSHDSVWIELGLDFIARVWFENGQLRKRVFQDHPWEEPVWINIGLLKDHVVLSGAHNQRIYRDKETLEVVEPPDIEKTLAEIPYVLLRATEDANGVIWVTHPNGVLTVFPEGDGYRVDTDSLTSIRDQYPVITLIDEKHAWISTESALYHVNQDFESIEGSTQQPFLVSVSDGKTETELISAPPANHSLGRLPYSQNHLVFRYFAGGYMPLQDLVYEFSMRNNSSDWKLRSADSLLTLPSLEEGEYQLTARLLSSNIPVGNPIVTRFTIAPPWYRSAFAYFGYWSSAIFSCLAIAIWAARRAKSKQDYLEKLVRERTEELRATMEKLTEEARNSATLAERNRLAGEIHDSLQQGLSGLALQLDATLKLNHLDPDLESRLSVARRMVSFTRQEVQQAVWDLESPLLQNDDLAEALRSMAELLGTGSMSLEVKTTGKPLEIPSTTKHHLLRIAQEAITNSVRHSGATRIQACLEFQSDKVTLTISDNGNGFDSSEVFSSGIGHFGLRGIRTRASKINGNLTISSVPQKGTSVQLVAPLNQTPQHSSKNGNDPNEN
ncbi:ATP-binding protein [Pelagicoccus sp. SDUM812003]|uniref:sensor histidine kinase n=1 Tax=Pelagicoccus sp. SDUM812003 TaxID=3041267 RepID=UPI00280CEFCB|nr:ATP-binding protein [Pelagicoccus sp. SDUM812003]MDQ8203508.1 histidine kinase [Pelagicoccus sp. SDUM812003]